VRGITGVTVVTVQSVNVRIVRSSSILLIAASGNWMD